MKDKLIIKYNSGNLAILCSKCNVIIKTGKDFTTEEMTAYKEEKDLPAQYCEQCKNKDNEIQINTL